MTVELGLSYVHACKLNAQDLNDIFHVRTKEYTWHDSQSYLQRRVLPNVSCYSSSTLGFSLSKRHKCNLVCFINLQLTREFHIFFLLFFLLIKHHYHPPALLSCYMRPNFPLAQWMPNHNSSKKENELWKKWTYN